MDWATATIFAVFTDEPPNDFCAPMIKSRKQRHAKLFHIEIGLLIYQHNTSTVYRLVFHIVFIPCGPGFGAGCLAWAGDTDFGAFMDEAELVRTEAEEQAHTDDII